MTDYIGQQLGNYSLTQLLGKGGFAGVYLGEHLYLKTKAAIKILLARLSPEVLERFLSEARLLSKLAHPQIIRLHDFGVEREIPFLVMDYAPGGTLRQRHPPGLPVDLPTVVSSLKQVAAALQYAHDHKFIHRDLKPENLLLGANLEVLLSDFGIALALNSAEYVNISSMGGTLAYMAPEQLQGKPRAASDQYSLGIIAYEWLSGERPFQGTLTEICSQHLLEPPPPLCEKVRRLPRAVEEVIFKALAKDPAARFTHVEDFALALEEASKAQTMLVPLSGLVTEAQVRQVQQVSTEGKPRQASARYNNLPVQTTVFVGREAAQKAAAVLLLRPEIRLLTLVGVGGIGKTRLALSLAAGVEQVFAHGVCFVPLAHLLGPDQVLATIAWTLGLREQEGSSLVERVRRFLHDKHLLLLLDNFERLGEAASELAELLAVCPRLKILVTSREVLHLSGEQIFQVPPLDLPNLKEKLRSEALAQCEAVALFVQRAKSVKPDFLLTNEQARIVAQICVRLEGIPLALELAAARITLLPPKALLTRLQKRLTVLTSSRRDLPRRQQTLRDTIKWSYDLLSVEEQQLFGRLSVFIDGCSLEAIEGMYSELGEDPMSVLSGVASLHDKSLVGQVEQSDGEPRFVMLETLREFGLECLGSDLLRCQVAHAAYYRALIDAQVPEESLISYHMPFQELEPEYSNILAAFHLLRELEEIEAALRMGSVLLNLWIFLGKSLSLGRKLLSHVIDLSRSSEAEGVRKEMSHALYSLGWIMFWQGDLKEALAPLTESLDLAQQLAEKRTQAWALNILGILEFCQEGGNLTVRDALFEKSLALFGELGDQVGIAEVLLCQGVQALYCGESEKARAYSQKSLEMNRKLNNTNNIAINLLFIGWSHFLEGDVAKAHAIHEESLSLARTQGYPLFLDDQLVVLGLELLAQGEVGHAQALFEEAHALALELESNEWLIKALYGLGCLAEYREDLIQAQKWYEEGAQKGVQMQHSDRTLWVMTSCLEGIGRARLSQGRTIEAAYLFGRADLLRRSLSFYTPIGLEQPSSDRLLKMMRTTLGEARFREAWKRGGTMTLLQLLTAEEPPMPVRSLSSETPATEEEKLHVATHLGLTRRECEVLRLLAQGFSNAQIAEHLVLSVVTVNSYLRNIYSKLCVSSRMQAVRSAMEHGLLDSYSPSSDLEKQ